MGIINVTPDSFSDGGRFVSVDSALAQAEALVEAGADLLDVGGESSRPGADAVALDEELCRVIPAVEAIAARVKVPISVDTAKAEVARQALQAGAEIVNDITAMAGDPAMARVVADARAAVVLMHMRGTPQTMQRAPYYDDVVSEVHAELARRIAVAESVGIARARIAIDPGIGFGKTFDHNLELLRNLPKFADLGCAIMVGTSRKGFLGTVARRPVTERGVASVASALAACATGAHIVRVHDVAETSDAIKVWTAVRGWD
jgi:dihydropteroate synthase